MTYAITIRQADERDRAGLEACFDDCEKSSGGMFVAEVNNRVVGFVCVLSRLDSKDILEKDRDPAYVTDLVVLEPYRKAGIGSELIRAAEAHAYSAGARRLRVGVLAANSGAHDLYRKLGCRDQEIVLEKTRAPSLPGLLGGMRVMD